MNWFRFSWLVSVVLLLSLQAGCASSDSAPEAVSSSTLNPYANHTSPLALALPTMQTTPTPTHTPAVTPAPVELGNIRCFPSGGNTTCFVPVRNPNPEALENVNVQITLVDDGGQILADQAAIFPLEILPAYQILPAVTIFKEFSTFNSARVRLLGSVRLISGDSRYRKTVLQNTLVSISWNGLSAKIQGRVFMPPGEKPAGALRLVAIAYDSSGQICGFRRWEWSGSLQPGGFEPFETTVYSLGASIEHVEVLVEALP
jgi:hypothetical protein